MGMFDTQVGELKKSVLFNLSLGSKELFHSNFLAWFIETFPEKGITLANELIGEDFFDRWTFSEKIEVKREKKNIDLQVVWGGKTLVVENKVKSIPYPEQLDEYSKGCNEQTTRFVLLSLTDPVFFKNRQYKLWKWVDYEMLTQRLLGHCPDGYEKEVVHDYCRFVSAIHEIARKSTETFSTTDNFLDYSLYDELKELRIHDLFDKWRFAWLAQHLQSRLEDSWPPEIHFAMTRGVGLLEAGFFNADKKIKVGVQLQGTVLRQFISTPTTEVATKNNITLCAWKLIDDKLWFVKNNEPLPGKHGKDEFCSYSGTFLYRHEELKEKFSADELCSRIIEMLGPAKTALAACEKIA